MVMQWVCVCMFSGQVVGGLVKLCFHFLIMLYSQLLLGKIQERNSAGKKVKEEEGSWPDVTLWI